MQKANRTAKKAGGSVHTKRTSRADAATTANDKMTGKTRDPADMEGAMEIPVIMDGGTIDDAIR